MTDVSRSCRRSTIDKNRFDGRTGDRDPMISKNYLLRRGCATAVRPKTSITIGRAGSSNSCRGPERGRCIILRKNHLPPMFPPPPHLPNEPVGEFLRMIYLAKGYYRQCTSTAHHMRVITCGEIQRGIERTVIFWVNKIIANLIFATYLGYLKIIKIPITFNFANTFCANNPVTNLDLNIQKQ